MPEIRLVHPKGIIGIKSNNFQIHLSNIISIRQRSTNLSRLYLSNIMTFVEFAMSIPVSPFRFMNQTAIPVFQIHIFPLSDLRTLLPIAIFGLFPYFCTSK